VPTVTLELATAMAPDATVRLDGADVAATDFQRVEVDPGHHVVDVRAPGHAPFHGELTIALRAHQTITVRLAATAMILIDPGRPRRHASYGLAAAGGALWLATLGYGSYERHVNRTGTFHAAELANTDLRRYGTAMFAASGAAIGTAIVPDQVGLALSGSF
jgi:PEGA domain